MPKNNIQEWSTNQTNNTDVAGFDISEGCSPAGINDALRSIMAQLATSWSGNDASIITGTSGSNGALASWDGNGDLVGGASIGQNVNLAVNTSINWGGTFSIVSDGTNTTINETGTGNARWWAENTTFANSSGSIVALFLDPDGSQDLYHAGTRKLRTDAQGVRVDGSMVMQYQALGPTATPGFGYYWAKNDVPRWTDGTGATFNLATTADVSSSVAAAPRIGEGQTWQDVSGSRVANTSYRNTTGKPIMVAVDWTSNQDFEVSTDDATWVTLISDLTYGGQFIVPDQHYYRVNAGGGSANSWVELR